MKVKLAALVSCAIAVLGSAADIQAAYTLQDGSIVDAEYLATLSLEDHYQAGIDSLQACNWCEAARQFSIVSINFPNSAYAQEALFFEGVALFYMEEYDLANTLFSTYLEGKNHPRLFQEVFEFKFAIAERFRCGAKKRLLGTKRLPKWGGGEALALQIYDEVIAALPCHELAVKSLYSKGFLLWGQKAHQLSVECFQAITRRFPKHEFAPECYLLINKVYLDQCCFELQNPDILAFAKINCRRFEQSFPGESRLCEAEADVLAIKELYAGGLYNTGVFYERIKKPDAAAIYYYNAARQFPETMYADYSRSWLDIMGYELPVCDEISSQQQIRSDGV